MFSFLLWLFLGLSAAHAQNTTCATRPAGDNSNACASTAFVNTEIGHNLPLPLSVPNGGTGHSSFTSNLPLLGNSTGALIQGTLSGNTTGFLTYSGTLTNGHCLSVNSGNAIDAGAACSTGTGSGTVSAGLTNQIAYYAANGTTVTGTFSPNIPSSGFWQTANGSYIWRLNDQILIGGATSYNGNYGNTGDWLSAYLLGETPSVFPPGQSASLYVTNNPNLATTSGGQSGNSNAIAAGAQTLGLPTAADIEGISSIVLNNNTTKATAAWAYYGEAHCLTPIAVACVGMEFDNVTTNNPGTGVLTPSSALNVVDFSAACGAFITSPTNFPCDVAYLIAAPNLQPFKAGLLFASGAIESTGSGVFNAIVMPPNYQINWFNGSTLAGGIYTDASNNLNLNMAGNLVVNGLGGATCGPGPVSGSFQAWHGLVIHC